MQEVGVRYVRLYADADGASVFEDVVSETQDRLIAEGVPPVLTAGPLPASALIYVEQKPEAADWEQHVAPRRQWIILLRGRGSITVSSGEVREFGPGDVLLVEDTTGEGHLSIPLTEDFAFVMIPTGD